MKNPRTLALHDVGQGLWLDNISRQLLQSGTRARYIRELSVSGLTSNPTIFERAIATGTLYDESIHSRLQHEGVSDFAKSWRALLARIGEKSHAVASAVSA